jgi:hypothetical protein
MNKEEFISTFVEGAARSSKDQLVLDLLGKLYDERQAGNKFIEMIDFMNDVARNTGWSMKCRSCGNDYEPDCELSEMHGAENYCGKNQWCTP